MSQVELMYEEALAIDSDVREHLPILRSFAERSQTIVELGFRLGISASALMAGEPRKLTIVDWNLFPYEVHQERLDQFRMVGLEQDTEVEFWESDSLSVRLPNTDMMFLDTFHTYEHLFLELIRHADSIKKYIFIHDTDDPTCPGMFNAIEDFLMDNKQWRMELRLRKRPGLVLLERLDNRPTFNYGMAFFATLHDEVKRQKEIYYQHIHPAWPDYLKIQTKRFANYNRWPLSNQSMSATELMTSVAETTSPQTDG